MKPTEIPKYYPELEGMDTTLHSDMYSALQSGMPVDEASQYYPEIFPQEAKKNFLNDSSKREGLLENV